MDDGGIISNSLLPQASLLISISEDSPVNFRGEPVPEDPTDNLEAQKQPVPEVPTNDLVVQKDVPDSENKNNFPRTGIGVCKSPDLSKISFSSDKIPIDTSLSHRNSKPKKNKRSTIPSRKSNQIRNSCQNLVQMSSLDWKDLLAFFIALGSIVFNSTPILEQHLTNLASRVRDRNVKIVEDQIEDLPDLDDKSPSTRTL